MSLPSYQWQVPQVDSVLATAEAARKILRFTRGYQLLGGHGRRREDPAGCADAINTLSVFCRGVEPIDRCRHRGIQVVWDAVFSSVVIPSVYSSISATGSPECCNLIAVALSWCRRRQTKSPGPGQGSGVSRCSELDCIMGESTIRKLTDSLISFILNYWLILRTKAVMTLDIVWWNYCPVSITRPVLSRRLRACWRPRRPGSSCAGLISATFMICLGYIAACQRGCDLIKRRRAARWMWIRVCTRRRRRRSKRTGLQSSAARQCLHLEQVRMVFERGLETPARRLAQETAGG
ncbi:hypothetical protein TFLX_04800 [Thermoflexales bacterium]|nr:hypothetical protein TFLX_04800 [Thermoflexales bacterium]